MKGKFNENTILYTYRKKPVEATTKPSEPLPGVAPPSVQVEEEEATVTDFLMKYTKAVYHWMSWWKLFGIVALIAILVIVFKYFVAYKLLMRYL